LHNSTTFHLAKTMVSLGYIRQEKDSKRYRVGRPLFALAASSLDEIEMVNVATPILEDLSRETGESSHFAVRMGDAVVVIARTSGPGAFQLTDRVGVVRPAHCTALGKAVLSAVPEDQVSDFLNEPLQQFTPHTIVDRKILFRELSEVRRRGYAVDQEETELGHVCIRVRLRDRHPVNRHPIDDLLCRHVVLLHLEDGDDRSARTQCGGNSQHARIAMGHVQVEDRDLRADAHRAFRGIRRKPAADR